MPACWTPLLHHLTRHGYLSRASGPALGPLGRLLLRNLTALWRRDVELGLGVPVVPATLHGGWLAGQTPPLTDAVSELGATRRSLRLSPPFGLCSERAVADRLTPPSQLITSSADDTQLTASASEDGRLTLLLAVPAASGPDWFQTLQRRRRIWWRELAEDPGNYSLAQRSIDGAQVVFDDQLVVERLRSHGQQGMDSGGGGGGTGYKLHLLSSEVCLHSALLAVCGDALDGGALRLQERLAPYRRAVPTQSGWSQQLRALAKHISSQLRAAGVPVFPLPADLPCSPSEEAPGGGQPADATLTAEEAACRCTDGAGVPLTVLLSESTLTDGVCRLRSRDTTLSHQIHVSQLTDGS